MKSDEYERPLELLTRLKIGREEYLQRLLTTLILDGPYPKWNTRSVPSSKGVAFLRQLDALSFGADSHWEDAPVFVDEFELPKRCDEEPGCAPDYAVLWAGRLWMIELKSERGSHRDSQIPSYSLLAHHHYPESCVDLTYLTPKFDVTMPMIQESRFAHVTWDEIAPLIRDIWAGSDELWQRETAGALLDAIDQLGEKPSVWRAHVLGAQRPAERRRPTIAAAFEVASATASDGAQRAGDWEFDSLEDLLQFRVEVRDAIRAEPEGSEMRHVRPWVWQTRSLGEPLTEGGRATGYELRFSRYAEPR